MVDATTERSVPPYTVDVGRERIQTLGWRAAIAVDVLVPVAVGAALVILLILIFAGSSAHGSD